jgi:heptaprenyl diphosphate synthase/octaprenyl-diphosphate synthase
MQTFTPAQRQHVQDIEAVIRARLAPHTSQIVEEALNSTAVALPRGVVAGIVLAFAQLTPTTSASAPHAAAALELIRAGASMHRRLFASRPSNDSPASMLHGPTLMLGDYFYALAASEMAEAPQAPIIADFSTCVMQLSEAFLASIPHDGDVSVARSLQHIDDVEGALVVRAIRAGLVCAGLPATVIDAGRLAHAIARIHALTIQLQEAYTTPLHSFHRGHLIAPLAYALSQQPIATQRAIDANDEPALVTLLHAHGIFEACTAIRTTAHTEATAMLTAIQANESRTWLEGLCNPDFSQADTPTSPH